MTGGGGGTMSGTTATGGAGGTGGYADCVGGFGCLMADDVAADCPVGVAACLPLPQMLDSCVSRAWRRDFMSIFTRSSSASLSAIGGGCFGDVSVAESGMVHWGVIVTGGVTRCCNTAGDSDRGGDSGGGVSGMSTGGSVGGGDVV